jgi:hypothetical protein
MFLALGKLPNVKMNIFFWANSQNLK